MKKNKFIAITALLLMSLSACGAENDTKETAQTEPPTSTVAPTEEHEPEETQPLATEAAKETLSPSTETEDTTSSQTENYSGTTLSDLENHLLNNGVLSGSKTQMAAEMVGAIDGFKYGDCDTEVYEYDVNSAQYIALSNGEAIELQGMSGFTVNASAINGKFVLMGNPSQEIIDCFNSFVIK